VPRERLENGSYIGDFDTQFVTLIKPSQLRDSALPTITMTGFEVSSPIDLVGSGRRKQVMKARHWYASVPVSNHNLLPLRAANEEEATLASTQQIP
jgi:hypothetical protein